jgi:hypothetical protein
MMLRPSRMQEVLLGKFKRCSNACPEAQKDEGSVALSRRGREMGKIAEKE